jgi:hypothetical protein
MSEQNKLIARRFIAAFAAGDTATLTQIVAENMIDHGSPPGTKPGRQGCSMRSPCSARVSRHSDLR